MRLPTIHVFKNLHRQKHDVSLSALLIVQLAVTFVLVPLVAGDPTGPLLMDLGLLVVAVLCAIVYADQLLILVILLSSMLAMIMVPTIWAHFMPHTAASAVTRHESISWAALFLNALITGLVFQQTFRSGQVTSHRILGAVFVYLNVAVLFSIVYDLLDTVVAGSIQPAAGGLLTTAVGLRRAELIYFSLTTITTCGYGDLVPVHPFARSLANLEAIFGQLFPATFVARLVALHLTQAESINSGEPEAKPPASDENRGTG